VVRQLGTGQGDGLPGTAARSALAVKRQTCVATPAVSISIHVRV